MTFSDILLIYRGAEKMLELYQNIRNRRKELGMSQDELAKKVGYTSRSTIARIENGEIDLPQSKIRVFAKALKTTPSDLMGLEGTVEGELEKEYKLKHDMVLKLLADPELTILLEKASSDKHFRHQLISIMRLIESDR